MPTIAAPTESAFVAADRNVLFTTGVGLATDTAGDFFNSTTRLQKLSGLIGDGLTGFGMRGLTATTGR